MHGPVICMACKHLRSSGRGLTPAKCDAYPTAIPSYIWPGGGDHRQPAEGDNGIKFELEAGRENLFEMWDKSQKFVQQLKDEGRWPTS